MDTQGINILEGLLQINGKDAYTEYGVFLSEENQADNKNYSALMKPSKSKEHTCVDFREQDGEKYPDKLTSALAARDVELQFSIEASDKTDFFTKYSKFVQALKIGVDGWLAFTLMELNRTFCFFYIECTSWDQITNFEGKVYASFKVKFREPNPAF